MSLGHSHLYRRPFSDFPRTCQFMDRPCNPCNLVNFGLDTAYSRGCQASTLAGVTMCCCSWHDFLQCTVSLTGTFDPLQDHVTLPDCQGLLHTYLPSLARLSSSITLGADLQRYLNMVSTVEDDGSWEVTNTMERDTEETTVTHITTVKTTHEGTTETKVKTVVKSRIHSTETTLRSPRKRSPSSVATITSPTTLASPSSTPRATHKLRSASAFVTPRPSVPRTSTSHTAVIPHPSDIQRPTMKPEGFYLVIVGQEVGIFYTWKDTAARVLEISGAVHYKCKTFQQALADYTAAYRKGELRAIPTPGGPFWPTAPRTPSPVLSEGERSYWAEVDDLSDVFSQVQLDPTGNSGATPSSSRIA